MAVLATASSMGSCAGEGGSTEWTVSVDTVGGTVHVINTPPESGAPPTLVGEEELRVGALEGGGAASFGLIRSVGVLPDGRFAVADGQAQEVRVFDGDGNHLRTFGGEGSGPGELQGMQGVYVDHEGLLRVAEQGNARLSVFHPDSGFVTSFPLQLFSYGFRGPWDVAVDSSGRTFVASAGRFGEDRYWSMLRIYDPSMTQLDSIPYYDYTDEALDDDDPPGAWRIPLGDTGWTFATVPFYARSHETLSPTGEFWSSAEGETRLEVRRWTPGGDTSLVLSSLRPPDPVTVAERDSAMAALVEGLRDRVPSLPALDPGRVPSTEPPLHGLSLDDRGRLWVRLSDPAADTTVYDVFDEEGAHAETVGLPFRIDRWIPPVIRGDTLWAVVTDDVDVQYVVRARLRPADPPASPAPPRSPGSPGS